MEELENETHADGVFWATWMLIAHPHVCLPHSNPSQPLLGIFFGIQQ